MAGPGDDGVESPDEDDGEWRFSLSDLDDDSEDETGEGGDGANGGGDGGGGDGGGGDGGGGEGVAGSFAPSETIEPGEIDPENALFVLLGVAIGLAIVGVIVAVYVLALF